MSGCSEKKEELRYHFLNERLTLSEKEVEEKSAAIINQLLQLSTFKEANVIHSYVSIKKNREVDTPHLIQYCLDSDKKIVVPKIRGEGKLQHVEIKSFYNLQENSWGVPEPGDGKEISVETLDLIIVPMVAGDHLKNRLGYGKGYYDRFLGKSSATKIGLLFDCQLYKEKLPVEEFDIPLDILITESQRIE